MVQYGKYWASRDEALVFYTIYRAKLSNYLTLMPHVRALIIASRTKLESGPQFAEVWFTGLEQQSSHFVDKNISTLEHSLLTDTLQNPR